MKKKIFIILLFLVVFTLKDVNATEFSNYLPGGKNYIDGANMLINGDTIFTEDDIFVKSNTTYTLSIPGFDLIGEEVFIEVEGQIDYLNDNPIYIPSCILDGEIIICTFTTNSTESFISLSITSQQIPMYYDYYQTETFQLEEGSVGTSYEEYIYPLVDTTTPEFTGAGAYIKSYQSTETLESIIDNHIVAIDDIDGDVSDSISVVSDEYTTNEQVVGEYDVLLCVSDNSGNEAFFTLTVIVKDEIAPVITGPAIVTISIDSTPTVANIIDSNFSIIDEYDSTTIFNIISDNYSTNKSFLGDYVVSFEVEDDYVNVSSKTFTISVVDTTSPEMVGSNISNSYLSNPLSFNSIIDTVSFLDNYDDLTNIEPTIITDNFTGNENSPGTYSIEIEVKDSSGNTLNETLTINVIDDILPVISGPISYSGSYENNLNVDDFINMLTISDNVDQLSNSDLYIISDMYSNRQNELGDYYIIFGLMDTNNNETIHQIDINLFDDVAPVIYVDNYIITVNLSATFNENDALKLLLNSGELKTGNYTIVRLLDEYSGNEKNPGEYLYHLSFLDDNGNSFEKEFIVKVNDSSYIDYEKDLLPRNIAIYTAILGYSLFIIIKKKRFAI